MADANVSNPQPAPDQDTDQKQQKPNRADRTARALRNTGIALCSVYPSPHIYMFFQDILGKVNLMNWDDASDLASKEFPGPGTVGGVLEEADNARWSTPLAAVAYETVRRYCCAREPKPKSNTKSQTKTKLGPKSKSGRKSRSGPTSNPKLEPKSEDEDENKLDEKFKKKTTHTLECDTHAEINKTMDTIHLFYVNSDNFLRSLIYQDGKWENDSKLSQCLVRVHPNTKLAAVCTEEENSIPRSIRVFYQGFDEQIHEYSLSHGKWHHAIVTRGHPVCGTWLAASAVPVYKDSIVLFYQAKSKSSSEPAVIKSYYKSPSTQWTLGAWKVEDPSVLWQRPYPFTLVCEPKEVPKRHSQEPWARSIIANKLEKFGSTRDEVLRLYHYSPQPKQLAEFTALNALVEHNSDEPDLDALKKAISELSHQAQFEQGARLRENAWVLTKDPEATKNPSDNYDYDSEEDEFKRKKPLVTCTHKKKLHHSEDPPDYENESQGSMYPGSDIASVGWLSINEDKPGEEKTLKSMQCTRVIYQCENGHFCSVDIMGATKKPTVYFSPEPEFFTLSDDIHDVDADFFKNVEDYDSSSDSDGSGAGEDDVENEDLNMGGLTIEEEEE